jgi:hypothetical protein
VRRRSFVLGAGLLFILGSSASASSQTIAVSTVSSIPFPRLANYFLGDPLPYAAQLARWDFVILPINRVDAATCIRKLNPAVKLVPYIASQETRSPGRGPTDPSTGFFDGWWLRHSDGSHVTGWRGNWLINVTRVSPTTDGRHWANHLSKWIYGQVGQNSVWDGIYFDNTWATIDWKSSDLDLQGSHTNDMATRGPDWVNDRWAEGMLDLMGQTRERLGPQAIIIGNGPLRAGGVNNGRFFESFPDEWNPLYESSGWETGIKDYQRWHGERFNSLYYVIDANGSGRANSPNDWSRMRFGLTSTLLGDGFFAFDESDSNHAQTWWYDEYSVDNTTGRATGDPSRKGYLGLPRGPASQLKSGMWRRDYDHGVAVVNPTNQPQGLALEQTYKHISGTQDPTVNDGSAVSRLVLPAGDGTILLRPLN